MFLNEQLSNWAGTTYVRQQNRKMDWIRKNIKYRISYMVFLFGVPVFLSSSFVLFPIFFLLLNVDRWPFYLI